MWCVVAKPTGRSSLNFEATFVFRKERMLTDPRYKCIFGPIGDCLRLVASVRIHFGLQVWSAVGSSVGILPEEKRARAWLYFYPKLCESSLAAGKVFIQIEYERHHACAVRKFFVIVVLLIVDVRLVVLTLVVF